MALCESFYLRMKGQNAVYLDLFNSANTSGAAGTNSKTLKPFRALTRDLRVQTQTFYTLKHDRMWNQKKVRAP